MGAVKGDSGAKETPAVLGENMAGGDGVRGTSKAGVGVIGTSEAGIGVWGGSTSSSGVGGMSESGVGVHGVSKAGPGVRGDAENGTGVFGGSKTSTAVGGTSDSGVGVHGISKAGDGVFGNSEQGRGVVGVAKAATGVEGNSTSGAGVFGNSETGRGVVGVGKVATGVEGNSTNGAGVFGSSQTGIGVHAKGGRLAGLFEGDVEVTGDIRLANADCAEDFDIIDADIIEPGTVMVLSDEGALRQSHQAYDRRVAGVVSGAGNYKPGIVLDKQSSQKDRKPIALLGKVYCKADAVYAPIQVGDLLTTSPSLGYAMKASDQSKAFGAVIGKALRPLTAGQGLIPILIALQ